MTKTTSKITFPNGGVINWRLIPGQQTISIEELARDPDYRISSVNEVAIQKLCKMLTKSSIQIVSNYHNTLIRRLAMEETTKVASCVFSVVNITSKVLEFSHSVFPHYNAGIILITHQSGYKEGKEFKATNGIIIKQKLKTGWDAATDSFYLRGSNDLHSATPVLISSVSKYRHVVGALKEYIKVNEYVSRDLMIKCHRETWLEVAKGFRKEPVAEAIARQYGLRVPRSYCFLCEYAAEQTNAVAPLNDENICKYCPAVNKWGSGRDAAGSAKPIERCVHFGSYYSMWDLEQDLTLKSALARRIAHIMDDTNQARINEYERGLIDAGEKIKGIKAFRERTGLGLKDAKDIIDKYIEDSINVATVAKSDECPF